MGAKFSKSSKGKDSSQGKKDDLEFEGVTTFDKTCTLPASFMNKTTEVTSTPVSLDSKTGSLPRNSGTKVARNASFSKRFRKSCKSWAKDKGFFDGKKKSPQKEKEEDDNDTKPSSAVLVLEDSNDSASVKAVVETSEPEVKKDDSEVVAEMVVEAQWQQKGQNETLTPVSSENNEELKEIVNQETGIVEVVTDNLQLMTISDETKAEAILTMEAEVGNTDEIIEEKDHSAEKTILSEKVLVEETEITQEEEVESAEAEKLAAEIIAEADLARLDAENKERAAKEECEAAKIATNAANEETERMANTAAEEKERIEKQEKEAERIAAVIESERIEKEKSEAAETARINAEMEAAEEAEMKAKVEAETTRIEAENAAAEEAKLIENEKFEGEETARLIAEKEAEAARIAVQETAADNVDIVAKEAAGVDDAARLAAEEAEIVVREEAETTELVSEKLAAEEEADTARIGSEESATKELTHEHMVAAKLAADEVKRLEADDKVAVEESAISTSTESENFRLPAENTAYIEDEEIATEEVVILVADKEKTEKSNSINKKLKQAFEDSMLADVGELSLNDFADSIASVQMKVETNTDVNDTDAVSDNTDISSEILISDITDEILDMSFQIIDISNTPKKIEVTIEDIERVKEIVSEIVESVTPESEPGSLEPICELSDRLSEGTVSTDEGIVGSDDDDTEIKTSEPNKPKKESYRISEEDNPTELREN